MVKKEKIMPLETNEKPSTTEYHLSDQALGAVMMALQKSLLEQSDIVPVLKGLRLTPTETNQLLVLNPPLVKVSHEDAAILAEAAQTTATTPEADVDDSPNQSF
tara:strand:- start:2479 stop:2790 length:312 start_codon:yes stop_codon:yes gene_type:complete